MMGISDSSMDNPNFSKKMFSQSPIHPLFMIVH